MHLSCLDLEKVLKSARIDEMETKTDESMKFEICRINKNHVPDHMCPAVGSVASGDE